MDISPYLNMEEPTRKGCNQRKVLTLSTTLFSDDVPWAKGAPIIFLSSTVPIRTSGLVRFLFQSIKFFVFVRDHVGRKVVCRGAAVKRRFPPFHWSREGLLPHHSGLLLIGILPMLKVACLPSHPLEKLVARKKRRGSEAVYEALLLPL